MFLATFLVGLREGLEAALIVAILATFLKRNGQPLKQLNIAALAAVVISILVGVLLMVFSQALPQAQQEAMEAIINTIAVAFVSTMILWMKKNARLMKENLEAEAKASLEKSRFGFVIMAFLAVIKEGFETAVFLLAILSSSTGSSDLIIGLIGAVVGILLACAIGYAIYLGSSKFNAGLFFKITGPFLVLLAAGFTSEIFRKAHEAGWVNIAQLQLFDFSSVINNQSVVGALLTGMFGIEADPRLIEVIAYFAYLLPMMVIYLWPQKYEFTHQQRRLTKIVYACICAVLAVLIFVAVPRVDTDVAGSTRDAELSDGTTAQIMLVSTDDSQAVISVTGEDGEEQQITLQKVSVGTPDITGLQQIQWEATVSTDEADVDLPTEDVTLNDLLSINGGRLPSGINKDRNPGPFDVDWNGTTTYSVRTYGTSLLRASSSSKLTATVSGGGIDGQKTVNIRTTSTGDWSVSDDETKTAEKAMSDAILQAEERAFWWAWVPCALGGMTIFLLINVAWNEWRAGRKAKKEAAEKAEKRELEQASTTVEQQQAQPEPQTV